MDRRLGLAFRLTLSSVFVVAVGLLLLGTSLIWSLAHNDVQQSLLQAKHVAAVSARLASKPSRSSTQLSLNDPGMVAAAAGRTRLYMQVVDHHHVIQQSASLHGHRLPLSRVQLRTLKWHSLWILGIRAPVIELFSGPAIVETMPIVRYGHVVGYVETAESINQMLKSIQMIVGVLTSAGILILMASLAVTIWMIWNPLRRISRLTETILQIETGNDLTARVTLRDQNDEVNSLAQAFNGMLDKLNDSFYRQKLIISQASHQLLTPVASARGYASLLSRWGNRDPQVLDEGMETLKNQLDKLTQTIQTILRLSSLGEDDQYHMKPVTVAQIINAWVKDYDLKVGAVCDAKILWDFDMGDELFAVLYNNAKMHADIRFFPEISAILVADRVIIQFRDFGPGAESAVMDYVFEPFVKGSASPGTGLGLSLAHSIVLHHRGIIEMENVDNPKGLLVKVAIPVWTGG